MKKHFALLGALLLSVSMLAGCGTSSPENGSGTASPSSEPTATLDDLKERGSINVAVKTDVPNFGYQNEDGSFDGLEIDIAYELAAALFGVESEQAKEDGLVNFIGVTYDERGTVLDDGTADFTIATFSITNERQKQWNFTSPYYTDSLGLMVKKAVTDSNSLGTKAITSISKLDGKIIGVARNTTTRDDLLAYLDRNGLDITPQFMEFGSYDALKKALDAGTIDVFSVDRSILYGYVDNKTTILPDKFAYQNYGIATAKANTELAEFAQQTLDEISQDGTLSELIRSRNIDS
ncbi:transporter substrate-binding domain-containing protein [Butyricicoccus sp.]|uniref:transporter substrate-binding domain-containing protein n=1 Tax=Butyricicoccus sp. TaxID=2049021 RepID=UPI003F13A59B